MKCSLRSLLPFLLLASIYVATGAAVAQETTAQPQAPAAEELPAADEAPRRQHELDRDIERRIERRVQRAMRGRRDDVILHIGGDSELAADERASAIVSILGSSTSAGEVDESVVSIFGNTRVTGPVGDAAVALFGNLYVDGPVAGDVVAVLGSLELGPRAEVDGEAIAVGGTIKRDPQATVHGGLQEVAIGAGFGGMDWLRPWLRYGALYGRPLALEPGLAWAWSLALGFLGLYVLISLLFSRSVQKCVDTLETQPGQSVIAAVLSVLLAPVLIILLFVTVIGIPLVPFVILGLFCASLFGKSVVLAALGRRVTTFTGVSAFGHVAIATLVGGLIVLGLYLVPVLGFIAFNVVAILGLGVVVYSLLLATKSRRLGSEPPVAAAAVGSGARAAGSGAPAAGERPTSATIEAPPGAADAVASASGFRAHSEPDAGTPPGSPPPGSPPPGSPPPGGTAASAPPPAPPRLDVATLPRAGFGIRMAALLIDVVLVMIIIGVLHAQDGLFLLTLAVYGALMWKLKGTTVGGIVCNLRVVRLDGRELAWDTAIVRALSCFLSLAFVGLGFFWILFDDERQSWHDKIAGTVVVRTPKGASLL